MSTSTPPKGPAGSAMGGDVAGDAPDVPVKTVSDSRVRMIQVAQHTACDVHDFLLLGTILKWMDICAVRSDAAMPIHANPCQSMPCHANAMLMHR